MPRAGRDIKLEIVRQLLASPTNLVVATARAPEKATALHDLKKTAKGTLHLIKLDISDFDGIRVSAKEPQAILGETGLDYLIKNAATVRTTMPAPFESRAPTLNSANVPQAPFGDTAFTMKPEELLDAFKTNVVGPMLVPLVALPFLEKGIAKKILHIFSTGDSVGSAGQVGPIVAGYAMSMSTLNMLACPRPSLL